METALAPLKNIPWFIVANPLIFPKFSEADLNPKKIMMSQSFINSGGLANRKWCELQPKR
jgi:hypothetical protein